MWFSREKKDDRRARGELRRPLFATWVHVSLGIIAVAALMLWLGPASAIREWSHRIAIMLSAICFLTILSSEIALIQPSAADMMNLGQ